MGVEFLGELPLKLDIRLLADAGTPIVAARPETEEAQAYRRIAARLWEGAGAAAGRASSSSRQGGQGGKQASPPARVPPVECRLGKKMRVRGNAFPRPFQ